MAQITVKDKSNEKMSSSIALQDVECGEFFNEFVESRKISPHRREGLTPDSAVTFKKETVDILNHCNPHDAVQAPETTHLVVGYVQSGKTMSFTGLTALALDNGYRVIIYLAGTKNNLLEQTSERLNKDLIGNKSKNNDFYRIHTDPSMNEVEYIVGHLELSYKPIILLPILKHYNHIGKLINVLNTSEFKQVMKNETVIIIDDEADQASLNNYGRKNSKEGREKDEEDRSSTYDAILRLRAILPGNTYIQYTATPQANILISMQDLLSPRSHTVLTPGAGYIGGKLFFGKGTDHQLFNGGLILQIPPKEVFHKKRNPLTKMPKSLKDAIMLHVLAVAIVVKWQESEDISFLSMMVHPDNEKRWNKKFKDWIDNELKNWRKALRMPDGCDDKVKLLDNFKRVFPEAVRYYPDEERPTFEMIEPYIDDVIHDRKVYLVNTDKEAQTKIEWEKYKMHILVGAEMLNRGFTIKNLATTYMPRYATSVTNADTIQQRCRFFGYKKDYIRSCRVFLPAASIDNYLSYVDHEEELRQTLKQCDSLVDAERKILLSPTMRPTRQNVLPVSVVNDKLKGMCAMQAFSSSYTINNNKNVVKVFLDRHQNDFTVISETTKDRTHRWMRLDIDEAIEFLSDFNFKNWRDAQRKANTIRYLRYLSSDENDSPLKYVYFYQMAFGSAPRRRAFDPDNYRFAKNTQLFAGKSSDGDSTDYKGDINIHGGDDSITIQLHNIEFDAKLPLGFPTTAYTLAIYYPDRLAANYCENIGNNIYDSEEDD